jgi:hypothetical protein
MPCALSAIWFPEHERMVSTSIAANSNVFGIGIGYFFPAMFMVGDLADYKEKFPI